MGRLGNKVLGDRIFDVKVFVGLGLDEFPIGEVSIHSCECASLKIRKSQHVIKYKILLKILFSQEFNRVHNAKIGIFGIDIYHHNYRIFL